MSNLHEWLWETSNTNLSTLSIQWTGRLILILLHKLRIKVVVFAVIVVVTVLRRHEYQYCPVHLSVLPRSLMILSCLPQPFHCQTCFDKMLRFCRYLKKKDFSNNWHAHTCSRGWYLKNYRIPQRAWASWWGLKPSFLKKNSCIRIKTCLFLLCNIILPDKKWPDGAPLCHFDVTQLSQLLQGLQVWQLLQVSQVLQVAWKLKEKPPSASIGADLVWIQS